VADFQSRFKELYPFRRPLLTCPKNEAGVPKFVCTTLRPTQLGWESLNDKEALAKFVAGFLDFEPLEDPLEPPAVISGPACVIDWQLADSYEFAIVLCSFLLGAGYDAYCVHGYAPRFVCEQDQSGLECPLLEELALADAAEEGSAAMGESSKAEEDSPYALQARFDFKSKFQLAQQRRAEERANEAKAADLKLMEAEEEQEADDPLQGKRVHCWVLVCPGKRGEEGYTFIEPTTGRLYPVDGVGCPYLGVEACWNNVNYFVNMQTPDSTTAEAAAEAARAASGKKKKKKKKKSDNAGDGDDTPPRPTGTTPDGMFQVEWDFANSAHWQLMFNTKRMRDAAQALRRGADAGIGGDGENMAMDADGIGGDMLAEGDEEEDGEGKEEAIDDSLDCPVSWCGPVRISQLAHRRRYGKSASGRTILFKRSRMELFAPHTHKQGIVTRVTEYEEKERITPLKVTEIFAHRGDKLERRMRFPLEGRTREIFGPGRPRKLRELEVRLGKWHRLLFYSAARLDGLKMREDVYGKSMTETFEGRTDGLTARSVTVEVEESGEKSHLFTLPGGGRRELVIRRMSQHFAKPAKNATNAGRTIEQRTFFLLPKSEARIHDVFHHAQGKITQEERTFRKDQGGSGSDGAGKGDPFRKGSKGGDDDGAGAELQQMLAAEKECYQAVREAKRETAEILGARADESGRVELIKSIFDQVRENLRPERDTANDGDGEDEAQVDYLTPFLPGGGSAKKELTKEEALKANDLCLRALKERLVERANIISRRLDRENEALAKRQAAFQRSRDPVEGADEEYEKFCMDAMFRIQILEQRLQKHEETAMDKYEALIKKLKEDERLAAMHV
jgi:hypothetical protein